MKTFEVRLCRVQRSCASIAVTAMSSADARVIAEDLLAADGVLFSACEEVSDVESILPTNAEMISPRRREAVGR